MVTQTIRRSARSLLAVALVGALALTGVACTANRPDSPTRPTPSISATAHPVKGVSVSPKSFGEADFASFFTEVAAAGSMLTWAGSWTELEVSSSAPNTVVKLADQYHYTPVLIVATHRDISGSLTPIQSLTEANRQRFVTAVADFAAANHPAYLGLGNEVNRLQAAKPEEYRVVTDWLAKAMAAVRQVSPTTKIFTVFQYEQLNGLNGGLFGGRNNPDAAEWTLLNDFPNLDLIAFTSYPYLIYKDPNDIPVDYYIRPLAHTTKAVAFTEIGWPSGTEAAEYASTPAEQARFIERFRSLVSGMKPEFVIWPFLYDQALSAPFTSVGLIGRDGVAKPALETWRKATFG